jgi:hypothetical protein
MLSFLSVPLVIDEDEQVSGTLIIYARSRMPLLRTAARRHDRQQHQGGHVLSASSTAVAPVTATFRPQYTSVVIDVLACPR